MNINNLHYRLKYFSLSIQNINLYIKNKQYEHFIAHFKIYIINK